MSWMGIWGCDELALQFALANRRGRLGGSFLFVGPSGVGKRTFAFALGKTLLCRRHFAKLGAGVNGSSAADLTLTDEEELARFTPCEECESCRQFDLHAESECVVVPNHPDFHYVCKPADRSLLPISLLVGDPEDRNQSGLCFELNQTAYMGGRKIAVIDDADYFNQEGANALLKTLEEPPEHTLIILLGTSATKQLPTIRSRCQIFRFAPLEREQVAEALLRRRKVETREEAENVARYANGSMTEAYRALDSDFTLFQRALLDALAQRRIEAVELAKKVVEYVDKASKEAIVRRPRLQNVLRAALAFYRAIFSNEPAPDAEQERVIEQARKSGYSEESAIQCAERTLTALEQIDQNANLPYIIEAWLYEVAAIARKM